MILALRPATSADFATLESLVIDSFESITWQKKLDQQIGPLNGCDWRERWRQRLAKVFATQEVLVGEAGGQLAAMASATIDRDATLGFIDVLAVGRSFQGRGFGREILRGMLSHLQNLNCQYVHLDCLTDNDTGNALYQGEGFKEVARHIRWFRKI